MRAAMITGLLMLATFGASSAAAQQTSEWLLVDIGIIGPASDDILASAMADAESKKYGGIVLRIDTPGGSLESTRNMVKVMLNAPRPILVWVGPSGARAGSAGAFITLAAHIAAMAPGTNIGAAHPVNADGSDVGDKKSEIARKIENDTAAFMESIAKSRSRNVELARSFVLTSTSITAEAAKDGKVIDLVTPSPEQMLAAVDGRSVVLAEERRVELDTDQARLVTYEPSWRQKLLTLLSNPTVFYLLFMAGLIGLGFELTHPGSIVPGVVGGVCLLLAMIATSVLPIDFGAIALVVVGLAFIVAEMFVPSFGILGIGGFVAFFLGSMLLIDTSDAIGLRIPIMLILPTAIVMAAVALGAGYLIFRAERSKVSSGTEGLVGTTGTVMCVDGERRLQVRVFGEIWQATVAADQQTAGIRPGDIIEVVGVKGLELTVRPKIAVG